MPLAPVPLEYRSGIDASPPPVARRLADVMSGLAAGISCFFFVGMLTTAIISIIMGLKGSAPLLLLMLAVVALGFALRAFKPKATFPPVVDCYHIGFWIGAAATMFAMAALLSMR